MHVQIAGVVGSIRRGLEPHDLVKIAMNCETAADLRAALGTRRERITSADVAAAAVLLGAKTAGAHISVVDALTVIHQAGRRHEFESTVAKADGCCFVSSIRFGSPSSTLLAFLSELARTDSELSMKPAGVCSVGARRNGGQDTANTLTAWRLHMLGMLLVGEGPPFGQSGGVLEARYPMDAFRDEDGIESCVRVGSRIHRAIALSRSNRNVRPSNLLFLCADPDAFGHASAVVNALSLQSQVPSITVLNLSEYEFELCKGCRTCPTGEPSGYRCCILDGFTTIHEALMVSDGIVFCIGAPASLAESRVWRRFMERTRYLRRSGYALADRIASLALVFGQHCASPELLAFLPFIFKHDMLLRGPPMSLEEFGNVPKGLAEFIELCEKSKWIRTNKPSKLLYCEEKRDYD